MFERGHGRCLYAARLARVCSLVRSFSLLRFAGFAIACRCTVSVALEILLFLVL